LGEHVLCKHEVVGSIPIASTRRALARWHQMRGTRVPPIKRP
jgi:hypothetical protein